MLLESIDIGPEDFERATGWRITPDGACKNDVCVPLPDLDTFDLATVADRLGMPLLADQEVGLWCLGPRSGGRVLESAIAPDLELRDRNGKMFRLDSLRGLKVLLIAWASW